MKERDQPFIHPSREASHYITYMLLWALYCRYVQYLCD